LHRGAGTRRGRRLRRVGEGGSTKDQSIKIEILFLNYLSIYIKGGKGQSQKLEKVIVNSLEEKKFYLLLLLLSPFCLFFYFPFFSFVYLFPDKRKKK
jgi:hypothetical protein